MRSLVTIFLILEVLSSYLLVSCSDQDFAGSSSVKRSGNADKRQTNSSEHPDAVRANEDTSVAAADGDESSLDQPQDVTGAYLVRCGNSMGDLGKFNQTNDVIAMGCQVSINDGKLPDEVLIKKLLVTTTSTQLQPPEILSAPSQSPWHVLFTVSRAQRTALISIQFSYQVGDTMFVDVVKILDFYPFMAVSTPSLMAAPIIHPDRLFFATDAVSKPNFPEIEGGVQRYGIAGADLKCQRAAKAAGLEGNFSALLAISFDALKEKVTANNYLNLKGEKVFEMTTTEYGDVSIRRAAKIYTEKNKEGGYVWTGIARDSSSARTCQDFTSSNTSDMGTYGHASNDLTMKWLSAGEANCGNSKSVYCVQN